MLRRRLVFGLPWTFPLALVFAACGSAPAVGIDLVMRAPEGLLDQASEVDLFVFGAKEASCDAASGHVSKVPSDAQKFKLDHSGCPSGASWCKTITLDRDGSSKVFGVEAKNASGILAEGCTTATIDQDPLAVDIQVERYNPPSCCNDGVLQAGEQCEGPPGPTACDGSPTTACSAIQQDAVCNCDCTSKEILASIDDGTTPPKLLNGAPMTKSKLAMTFAPGNEEIGDALRMVFLNTAPDGNSPHLSPDGVNDISVRFFGPDLYPIVSPAPLALQLELPLTCADVTGKGISLQQDSPSIAVASADTIAIAYASDENHAGTSDIFLTPQTLDGCTDAHQCTMGSECQTAACTGKGFCATAVKLNAVAEETPGSNDVRIAGGPDGTVMAVWVRAGHVFGRIWQTNGSLSPAMSEIDVAPNATNPRIAGTKTGFLVAYEGSSDNAVHAQMFDGTGAPSGEAIKVNAKSDAAGQPDVAAMSDGRAIVVWQSGGQIFFQRYDAKMKAVEGDQDAPLSTSTSTSLAHPAVASGGASGDFYAVAWEDDADNTIHARFAGASSGFLYNSVDGQNDDFLATDPTIPGTRSAPAVAVGGNGYVVVGWQDDSASHPGIFVRRFPLPTM